MQQSLAVLIVEDRELDAALLTRELRRAGYELFCERVDNGPAMAAALNRQAWDIVLADYSLPQFNAVAALSLVDYPAVLGACRTACVSGLAAVDSDHCPELFGWCASLVLGL